MFDDFMDEKCDIFHLVEKEKKAGYGIKAGTVMEPESEPSEREVPCHFHKKQDNYLRTDQEEPHRKLTGQRKLTLPIGTDIRINDIIRDCENGLLYRAEKPENIRGHHIVVIIRREEDLRAAL